MTTSPKTLSVAAIKEGTVIDHITVGSALKIIRFLRLEENEKRVTVGLNLKSESIELKDIVKVENFFLSATHVAQIAIFAPHATVNVIENYVVAKKFKVQMPSEIAAILRCPNPRCVTNSEPIQTFFSVEATDRHVILGCRFCEKSFSRREVEEKPT